MVIVLGDLLVDLSLRVSKLPVDAGEMHKLEYIELGPGGATNVAITAARLGLPVSCLGEIGQDRFGQILLENLAEEGVDTSAILAHPEAATPLAAVLVDPRGEPAYLGFRGRLTLKELPHSWRERIQGAEALFADGWVEEAGGAAIILEAFRAATAQGVMTFFDAGPGNPALDISWHVEVAGLADVVLANAAEAERLTGTTDPRASGRSLLAKGAKLVVIKLGPRGCLLLTESEAVDAPAYPVELLDATGAGDSVAGAIIFGRLKNLPLGALGALANATGAAKVQKNGTGRNMPTRSEIKSVLSRFGQDNDLLGD